MTKSVAGPIPNPSKPKLVAPPGACDCHCHIFGPVDRFPYVPERNYTPPEASLESYLTLMRHLGVERTVIVQPSIHGFDNAVTEDAIARIGENARGVAVVDPEIDADELKRLDAAGFRGVRFNLYHKGGSTPLDALEALSWKVAPLGWHVQVYMFGKDLVDVGARIETLPAEVVIDHLGHFDAHQDTTQAGFGELLRLMEKRRTWVKICPYRFEVTGYPYPKAKPFVLELNEIAPDRLVWGTDWPHPDVPGPVEGKNGEMPDDGKLLDALVAWFDDKAIIDRVLAENPVRLYGFGS